MHISDGRCLVFFRFRLKSNFRKKIGADTLVSSFRMHYYCIKNKQFVKIFCLVNTKEWTNTKEISRKRIVVLCVGAIYLCNNFFPHPICYPRTTLALLPSSNSDPGSHSEPFSPLPTSVRAFIFIARRIQHFLPASTRVKMDMVYT